MKSDFIKQLNEMLHKGADDCTLQNSLRDILTDLRHVATTNNLDFDAAFIGSEEVYLDEKTNEVLSDYFNELLKKHYETFPK